MKSYMETWSGHSNAERAGERSRVLWVGNCLIEGDAHGVQEIEDADDKRGTIVGLRMRSENKGGWVGT